MFGDDENPISVNAASIAATQFAFVALAAAPQQARSIAGIVFAGAMAQPPGRVVGHYPATITALIVPASAKRGHL